MTAVPEPSPEATPGSPVVTVMLVSRFGGKAGCDTLAALADSTLRPDRIVIVDLGTAVGARDEVLNHPALGEQLPTAIVHRERIGIGTAQALNQAVAALPAAPGRQDLASVEGSAAEPTAEHPDGLGRPTPAVGPEWLWFLTEDSRPEPDALRLLVDAVRRSPSVGMAGTKVLDAANPRHLLDVGLQITRSGRRIAAPQRGEPDQGQYDTRTDVLAVTLPGMLVRREVFERIGGFECALPAEGRPLDLGWRAQLAGARVIVVPAARIYVPDGVDDPMTGSTAGKLAHLRAQRSAARRVCLARCSPWLAPLLAIWIVLTSVTSALAMLMLKRPAHAWVELGDLSAVVHPISSVVARWRFRTRRGLRRRDLATVFVTSAEALRHTVDRVHDALTPGGDRSSDGATASMGALEAGPVAEEAEDLHVLSASLPERIATNPGVLAVVTAGVAAAIGFRSTLRGGLLDAQGAGLAGGELQPLIADASGLWHAWRDAWRGAGFGTSAETGPWLAVLSGITWLAERIPLVSEGGSPAAVVLAWVLVLGLPLATAAAYVAAKTLRAARWPRALAALAWGCSGVAVSAASGGRATVMLAHVLLPLVAAGVARCARSDATFTAAAATSLGAGVLVALVPVYLPLVALAALGLVVLGPGLGGRLRGLALLGLPLALQGAWLLRLADPATVLGTPGLLDSESPREGVQADWSSLVAGFPDGSSPWVLALAVPVLVAAIATLVRRPRSRAQALTYAALGLLALLGLGWSLIARRFVVGGARSQAGEIVPAVPWPGVGTQLYLLAVLGLALLGSVGMRAVIGRHESLWARVLPGLALAVVSLAVLSSTALQAWARIDGTVVLARDATPAVAREQAHGPEANRLLVLVPTVATLEFELVGREPGAALRGLAEPVAHTDPGLVDLVEAIAAGRAAEGTGVGTGLGTLGIGFVSVRGIPTPELARTLDATSGLTRLGSSEIQTLWRVDAQPSASGRDVVPPSRVHLVDASGAELSWLRVSGAHAALTASIPAGATGRQVVPAEPLEWARWADVRFDGAPLSATVGAGLPAYELPARAGTLTIEVPPSRPRWFAAQLALLALVVFLAIPFGNRRSRRVR